MLSSDVRKTLYDPKNFKGVSSETRTDIIGMIDFDLEGLAQEEGGKFTYEELCNGLHYLLATDKDLHAYIEQHGSKASSSDPFFIPSRKLHELGLAVSCLGCLADCDCFDGEGESVVMGCVFLCALVAIVGIFVLIYKNTRDMLRDEESNVVKMLKIMMGLIVFIGVTAPVWFFIPSIYVYGLSSVLAFFCGALALALVSYVNKKILFLPSKELLKPSSELLDELGCIKKILKESYVREGDNKEACKEFVKAVVRLHINAVCKAENVENSPSLRKHGSFYKSAISTQPANDADKDIEASLTYGASI